ncbi:MAG: DUF1428 domain-containing protein [Deltaproteobacteria bacterium]|nr:DUF1428 domain-containing protein [Deltaproteobacteria bacterium]
MSYVDGYLLPIPKKNIKAYAKVAKVAGKVWKEHGALDYKECVGDDMKTAFGIPFPKTMKLKAGEVAVFSYIVFKSRAHRNSVNKKVMKDPRILESMQGAPIPFDCKRMVYGGFKVLVDA